MTVSQHFLPKMSAFNSHMRQNAYDPEVKVSRNGPERRSGKRIVAGTAFRLEFQVHYYVGYLFLFN